MVEMERRKGPLRVPSRSEGVKKLLTFHSDWFSEHEHAYDQILAARLAAVRENARVLVIGTVEGRSVEWFHNNMTGVRGDSEIVVVERPLTRKDKEKTCVKTRGIGIRISEETVRKTLRANLDLLRARKSRMSQSGPNIVLHEKRPTTLALMEIATASIKRNKPFDVILIDSLKSQHALECAVLSFTALKPGGVMVFTNYTHGKMHDNTCPRRGIDGFLDAYVSEIHVLRTAFHLFLERRLVPLEAQRCNAEVYD